MTENLSIKLYIKGLIKIFECRTRAKFEEFKIILFEIILWDGEIEFFEVGARGTRSKWFQSRSIAVADSLSKKKKYEAKKVLWGPSLPKTY